MASTIQVDKITDIGGNTMIESNGQVRLQVIYPLMYHQLLAHYP